MAGHAADSPEPVYATVFESDGRWWLRVRDGVGNELSCIATGWDGSGGFHLKGLDWVAPHIPAGYVYKYWDEADDGTFSTVLHRRCA